MSTPQEEEKIVDVLKNAMLKKLAANRYKQHWRYDTEYQLVEKLRQELKELRTAILSGDADEVIEEAADAANFLAMIADNFGTQRK